MGVWIADQAWLGGPRLERDVLIEAEGGVITRVEAGTGGTGDRLEGITIPGLANAHSHAFHRLLRGRTHRQGGDFWAWREAMYEAARSLDPDTYREVANAVYVEMAMAGITVVGEFHYLHHRPGGTPYADPNEMGHALVEAARSAGLRVALLDVCYLRSGFDGGHLHPVQERFSDGDVAAWQTRVSDLAHTYQDDPDVVVGAAPHSVRAVAPEDLAEIGSWVEETGVPAHIHLSEQPAENQAALEATGSTPARLLASAGLLGPRVTAVHATHLTEKDMGLLGSSGTGNCQCPTTERDLADGIGPASELAEAGSALSLGSDSHAVVDLFEEARGVEMHARLASGSRGVFAPEDLLEAATSNGYRALGFEGGRLAPGAPADWVTLDTGTTRLSGLDPLDAASVVFAATAADVRDVYVGGRGIVEDGRHSHWEEARTHLSGR